jgi:AraC-like DNA-binding protein
MYRANETVRLAAAHIVRELKRGDPVQQSMVECLSGWIVTELQRSLPMPDAIATAPASVHVQTARTILDLRFREPLSIGSVAQELFIHPDYLRQLFRQQLGESPIHYLLRKRIDYACALLRETDQPIKEIAARSGLENPYYFSRLFRKWVGKSPSEYRANGHAIG